jgi:hypothetical protein
LEAPGFIQPLNLKCDILVSSLRFRMQLVLLHHVNLKKNTLTVEPEDPAKPDKLKVKFTFDANVECWASVFLVASENPKVRGCYITVAVGGCTAVKVKVSWFGGLGRKATRKNPKKRREKTPNLFGFLYE